MTKKLYKYTQYPPFYLNQYSWGGDSKEAFNNAFSSKNAAGSIAGVGGALTSIIGAGMNNAKIADTSGIENNIKNIQSQTFEGSTNDQLLSSWGAFNPIDRVSYKDIRGGSNGSRVMSILGAGVSGAGAGATVGGPWGAVAGAVGGIGAGIWGALAGNKKANAKTAELNAQIAQANQQALNNFGNSVQNVDANNDMNLLANYSAYGGHTHGAQWDNGVTTYDNGSTHESNPNGGIMIGVDPQGIPNMVEEGEVKFNDYIFSNRIKMPKALKEQYKLKKNSTFADAAKKLSKESDERPNDPISKAGLNASMTKLTQMQEFIKEQQQPQQQEQLQQNAFAGGGFPKNKIPKFIPGPMSGISEISNSYKSNDYSLNDVNEIIGNNNPYIGVTEDYWNNEYKSALKNNTSSKQKFDMSLLRYAPVLGSGIGVFSDLMGWTNKPNYDNANMITDAVRNTPNVQFNPIGNQMTYKPLDRNYYLNQLYSNAGASRRDIINQSGGNRATAMAGILGADYNTTSNIGKLARESEEYNLNQRQKVEDFNRSTNMFNTEGSLKAQTANQANHERKLRAIMAASEMRQQADMLSTQGKTANLTNLFDSIGDIGREFYARNMIMSNPALYYTIDSTGKITYKNDYYKLSPQEKDYVDYDAYKKNQNKTTNTTTNINAKGGYLTIKRR